MFVILERDNQGRHIYTYLLEGFSMYSAFVLGFVCQDQPLLYVVTTIIPFIHYHQYGKACLCVFISTNEELKSWHASEACELHQVWRRSYHKKTGGK